MPSSFFEKRRSILRHRPLVVGTLTGRGSLDAQLRRGASPFVDVIELRLDTFSDVRRPLARVFAAELLARIRRKTHKPVLLTLRSHTEQPAAARGARRLTDDEREKLIVPLLTAVQLVDVEARRRTFAARVTALARRMGVSVIHSYHDFRGAGRRAELDRLVHAARRQRADVFKAAVTPRTERELDDLFRWGLGLEGIGRVLIGMGPHGAPSRTIGFTFGSLLTYGHLGTSAAPGQWPAAELGRAVRDIYGAEERR
ncbi:MAG: type I 3-dehydroquinate dehydratase [Elusimicrobia bacterium]|nr:type I 3-dehydroquinate dehydratase [Elusimicrobiota bacterium]